MPRNETIMYLDKEYTKTFFNSFNLTHYALDDKLLYLKGDEQLWYNQFSKTLMFISNITKSLIKIDLSTSFTQIKLLELNSEEAILQGVLKLCHTGK